MVQLVEGQVYRTWALVTRAGLGMHRLIDVQADHDVPYAVVEWRGAGDGRVPVRRVGIDAARLGDLSWPTVDLLYTGRIDLPPDAPLEATGLCVEHWSGRS